MRIYVAGPMNGYPLFNYPAFDKAAKALRDQGHEVFNPADHDREVFGDITPETADAKGFSRRAALKADTAWICENAEGLALLDGWRFSKGATAEVALAVALDIPAKPWRKW